MPVVLALLVRSKMSQVLTGAEIDTLVALVERGPLRDGDIPSKAGRNGLHSLHYAAQVIINQDTSYFWVATTKGLEWYLNKFGADNIQDARFNRIRALPLP